MYCVRRNKPADRPFLLACNLILSCQTASDDTHPITQGGRNNPSDALQPRTFRPPSMFRSLPTQCRNCKKQRKRVGGGEARRLSGRLGSLLQVHDMMGDGRWSWTLVLVTTLLHDWWPSRRSGGGYLLGNGVMGTRSFNACPFLSRHVNVFC